VNTCFAVLLLAVTAGAQVTVAAAESPSDDDLRALVAYGQTWHKPDQLYLSGLPESVLVGVSSGRAVRFMTDRAYICIEACRAKLLLKPFGVTEARAIFNPNRLHAILEATSLSRAGAAHAAAEFGGRDLNLVFLIGGQALQPRDIGGAEGGVGPGVQLTQVSRVGGGFYAVNTLDLTPGFMSRAFTFELPSPVAEVEEGNFILVNSKGKQRKFAASLLRLRAERKTEPALLCDYNTNASTRAGKAFPFRIRFQTVKGGPDADAKIVRAESIWRPPEMQGGQSTKIRDLSAASVFSFQSTQEGGLYRFDLPTDGLEPGRYEMRVRVEGNTKAVFFNVKD